MIGNPKYKLGDILKFQYDGKDKIGIVCIIDKYGTFFDDSDVSYDVMVTEEMCLYKHLTETSFEYIGHLSDEEFKKVWK